jgi:hypothetical protein
MKTLLFVLLFCATNILAQGTFKLGPPIATNCPAGFACKQFTVDCPNIQQVTGYIANEKPTVPEKGMIVFVSASSGGSWWSDSYTLVPAFFQSLLRDGYELVQIKMGWTKAQLGVQSGQVALAAREATVVKWVHDNWLGAGIQLIVTGQSGGSSAVAYSLSNYGLDSIVDAAILTSGPPMASIQKGCLQEARYAYATGAETRIDSSYGYADNSVLGYGPCYERDPHYTQTWINNSNDTGGLSYFYPAARISIIVGGQDTTGAVNHARDYYQVLVANGQAVSWTFVQQMGHPIQESPDGLLALKGAIERSQLSKTKI